MNQQPMSTAEKHHYQMELLNLLWERYWVNRNPIDLLTYLKAGGDTAGLEKFMIDTLETGRVKKLDSGRNRQDPHRDILAYIRVEDRRDKQEASEGIRPSILNAIFDMTEGKNENDSTLSHQYDRGRKWLFHDAEKKRKTVFGRYFLPDDHYMSGADPRDP